MTGISERIARGLESLCEAASIVGTGVFHGSRCPEPFGLLDLEGVARRLGGAGLRAVLPGTVF